MDIYRVVISEERTVTYEVVADSIDDAEDKILEGKAEVVDEDTLDYDIFEYSVEHREDHSEESAAASGFPNDTPADGVGLW